MKLYLTTGENEIVHAHWNGSQADASKQRSAFKKLGHTNVQTQEEDIPTNKVDLLTWLNANKVVV